MKTNNVIKDRSYTFALRSIELYKGLLARNEFLISRQFLRAATSIGANVEEAIAAQSRADFISKMSIASKEARETNYWLRLLKDSKMIDAVTIEPLLSESAEIIKIITSIVKTTSARTSTQNSKLKIQNSKFKTQNSKLKIQNSKPEVCVSDRKI